MHPTVALQLLALNRQFYQTFALQFSTTRQHPQPGVQRILERLPATARLLDLGCGNGSLALALLQRGFSGIYVGLDNSQELLALARERVPFAEKIIFLQADISAPDWEEALNSLPERFDYILAFAVLHHIPGSEIRRRIMKQIRARLEPEGYFIHSEWQFLNSPRWRQRIQAWESIGLEPSAVEEGDYLLDWRHLGYGLRYVHHFSEAELSALASQSGFSILETFFSDGKEGNLGLYQIWKPAP